MNRLRLTATACALAIAMGLAADAGQTLARATPESLGLDEAKLRAATELLNVYVTDRKIAGAVAAVARKGKLAYLQAVGVQDLDSKAPMTERSLFRIYSMTKPVTAVAVMMLHEQGRFQLNDPVSKYLPEFDTLMIVNPAGSAPRRPARAITVEDLLLHTSGLSHRTSELYRTLEVRSRQDTLPVFIAKITKAPLLEDPGTRFRYSEATTVLGRLVEVWSGQAFDAFLDKHVFGPLNMRDTVFVVRPDQRDRLATVYAPSPGGGLTKTEMEAVPVTERAPLVEGAVGLVSSVPDYLRFSQMLLNKGELDEVRLLKAATVERMTTNGLPADVLKARGGSTGWGLANVNVNLDPASATRGEYGWDGTAGTIFWIDPAREMITILMTQSSPPNPDSLRQRFKALIQQAVID